MLVGVCRADAVLLVEDPVNFVGRFTSSGHSAVWMDRICSDDHVTLRACRAGEAGTVISRYPGVAGKLDWLAMAPANYLFGVERADEVPKIVTSEDFSRIQAEFRKAHAASFERDPGDAAWLALSGEAYRRRMVLVRVKTTEAQDADLMNWLNERKNVSHFNVFAANCADFTGLVLAKLFGGGFHRNYLFDAGMMTPKQNLYDLRHSALRHPEVGWSVTVLPQVPGELPRSGHVRGVAEAYLKSWWFLLPLDALDPFELGAVTVLGAVDRRYVAKGVGLADVGSFFGNDLSAKSY